MKFIVGLTGGIGSGKSAVSQLFEDLDIGVVDADICSRQVVEPGTPALEAIAEKFTDAILLDDGSLNRVALRKIVFEDPQQRVWLEQLTHPLIAAQIQRQLASCDSAYAMLVSPLLLETNQADYCNTVVVVDVPTDVQIVRASARDSTTTEQIKSIIKAQTSREARLEKADYVIENSGTLQDLEHKVSELHEQFLKIAARPPS